MRCIEIAVLQYQPYHSTGLTLTWDVLKYDKCYNIVCTIKININMRCIEIRKQMQTVRTQTRININMRCIEIKVEIERLLDEGGLTLTWDVLKFRSKRKLCAPKQININMRCIEIQ